MASLDEPRIRDQAAYHAQLAELGSGEIILLIDSDTRVPEDCFMDASMEMTQSPHVAIM